MEEDATAESTKERLALQVDVADWLTLRAHLERGGLIVVHPELDISEVGARIASDDVPLVENWILKGQIGKPTHLQVERWDLEKLKLFRCLIVSPYVLIQEETPDPELE
ncbi:DUF2288 domain-containing protein [Geomonas sp. RF6]|uniref:DUF2288 domain-containing protein n=1 Tax=Geomonas sp. RF6 TaxID=2897342 RepID=UPI001E48F1BC|nr:DUF2288 domain-containing protein [Geomonas sp. RF6]UFS72155.1 DUF2288 domain-containing protein [Geomonas sp. RF6]